MLSAVLLVPLVAFAGEPILFGEDGSVKLVLAPTNSADACMTLKFGLPSGRALTSWREGTAWRRLWVTNGVHYMQTLMLSTLAASDPDAGSGQSNTVLLVNIEGQNTNSEYAGASAELTVEVNGNLEPLKLENGLVWRLHAGQRALLGALEIPESGIESTKGSKLRFRGNMPPSLNGCMTLKVPLEKLRSEHALRALADLSFEQEFHRNKLGPQEVNAKPRGIVLPEDPKRMKDLGTEYRAGGAR